MREQQDMLERERRDLEKRIRTLIVAIETGGDALSLTARLRELESRCRAIDQEVAKPPSGASAARIGGRESGAEWRRLLRQSTMRGRAVLQRIPRGRIVFTPTTSVLTPTERCDRYTFEAPTRFDKLFSGVAMTPPSFAKSGNLATDGIGATDTEADYGRLLERAERRLATAYKRSASPTGFEPVFWP
jgi:hypothetical protein